MTKFCDICKKEIKNYHYFTIAEGDNGNVNFNYEFCFECYKNKIVPFIENISKGEL